MRVWRRVPLPLRGVQQTQPTGKPHPHPFGGPFFPKSLKNAFDCLLRGRTTAAPSTGLGRAPQRQGPVFAPLAMGLSGPQGPEAAPWAGNGGLPPPPPPRPPPPLRRSAWSSGKTIRHDPSTEFVLPSVSCSPPSDIRQLHGGGAFAQDLHHRETLLSDKLCFRSIGGGGTWVMTGRFTFRKANRGGSSTGESNRHGVDGWWRAAR